MSGPVHWRCLPFDALHARTLYALLRLRTQVFVMEQRCIYLDMDGADVPCFHLLGERAQSLVGYARLVPPGLKFTEASIGRVITDESARGTGLGHVLIDEAVRQLHAIWGVQAIRISAQSRLQAFYRQHGFEPEGEIYLEDGIDHIEMLLTP
ncbi:GNAT family N-acetyltransferase [Hydrogenophaga sp.]|uniref:GNAT family N-acetyltransferase n=1 Tax=Hydrogenophaga sp. TaxID=1904254 RepID=UPI002624A502|nr:GNAT family N-acetyltransferase [Hydrogenophaga sp.]